VKEPQKNTNKLRAVKPQQKKNETTDYADFMDFFRQDNRMNGIYKKVTVP